MVDSDGDLKAPGRRSSVVEFFNTGLGLWLLSTIVVGLGAWAWQEGAAAIARRKERENTIQKLDVEIGYRLRLQRAKTFHDVPSLLETLPALDGGSATAPFPEYANRPLFSLVWELTQLAPTVERPPLKDAQETALAFYVLRTAPPPRLLKSAGADSSDAVRGAILAVALQAKLVSACNLPRWGLPYTATPDSEYLLGQVLVERLLERRAVERDVTKANGHVARVPGSDLSSTIGPVRDTGTEGTVVGHAIAYALQSAVLLARGRAVELSARGIYAAAQVLDEWDGSYEGTSLAAGLDAVVQYGALLTSQWPDDQNEPPIEELMRPAVRASRWRAVPRLEEVAGEIANGRVVLAGLQVRVCDRWGEARGGVIVVDPADCPVEGLTAVTLVGTVPGSDSLRFANTWGQDWGDHGFGTISRAGLERIIDGLYVLEL